MYSSPILAHLAAPELLQWARDQKKLLGLTNDKLAELSGCPAGTIDRIFSGKYSADFKYSTIQPIIAVLIGLNEPTEAPETPKEIEAAASTLDGMKMVIDSKNIEIAALKDAYDHIKKGYYNLREDFDKAAADSKAKTDYLKERVEYLKQESRRKDRWVAILAAMSIALFLVIIAILAYDLTHPDVGWYQSVAAWFSSMGVTI